MVLVCGRCCGAVGNIDGRRETKPKASRLTLVESESVTWYERLRGSWFGVAWWDAILLEGFPLTDCLGGGVGRLAVGRRLACEALQMSGFFFSASSFPFSSFIYGGADRDR